MRRWTRRWRASRRTSARGSGDASGVRLSGCRAARARPRPIPNVQELEPFRRRPLVAQDAHQQGVAEAVLALHGPPEAPLVYKAEPLVGGDGRVVEIEDAEAHAIQAEVLEGVLHDQPYGLGAVAVAPIVRAADDHGQLRRLVRLAQVHQANDADGLLLSHGMYGERVVRGGELALLEEPLDGGAPEGGPGPAGEVPDLRVAVPFGVQAVVLGVVAEQLHPLAVQLPRPAAQSHAGEYTRFRRVPLC